MSRGFVDCLFVYHVLTSAAALRGSGQYTNADSRSAGAFAITSSAGTGAVDTSTWLSRSDGE
jgi:hypothetical protein